MPLAPSFVSLLQLAMEIAKLVLEYVQVLFSWPVIFGGLVFYFLKQHGQLVSVILQRLTSVSLPGGVTLNLPYPSSSDPPPLAPALPQKGGTTESIEKDFTDFLWQGIAVNRLNVKLEINRLWSQLGPGFFLDVQHSQAATEAATDLEKMQAMMKAKRISEKAVEDFVFVGGLKGDAARKDLLAGYRKSNVLYGYLLHARSW